jgi:hypothetical protein
MTVIELFAGAGGAALGLHRRRDLRVRPAPEGGVPSVLPGAPIVVVGGDGRMISPCWQYDRDSRRWEAIIGSPTDCGMTCPMHLEVRDGRFWSDCDGARWGWTIRLDDNGTHVEVRRGTAHRVVVAKQRAQESADDVEREQLAHAAKWAPGGEYDGA